MPVAPGSREPLGLAPALLDERLPLKLLERDAKLLLRVHHDRPVPRDGLANGLSRDEEKPYVLRLRRDGDLVAVPEEDQVTITDQPLALHVEVVRANSLVA